MTKNPLFEFAVDELISVYQARKRRLVFQDTTEISRTTPEYEVKNWLKQHPDFITSACNLGQYYIKCLEDHQIGPPDFLERIFDAVFADIFAM